MHGQTLPALTLISLLLAHTAQADPAGDCLEEPRCQQHYLRGVDAFKAARYESAREAFQAAYDATPSPWLLLNIGRSMQRLGRLKEALEKYRRFQLQPGDARPEFHQAAAEYIAEVTQELQRPAPSGSGAQPDPPLPEREPSSVIDASLDPYAPGEQASQAPEPHRSGLPMRGDKASPHSPAALRRYSLGFGIPLLAAGATMIGFGISALAVKDQCAEPSSPGWTMPTCGGTYATVGPGSGLLVAGLLVSTGAAVILALPRIKKPRPTEVPAR